jgi:hypothetical protein
MVTTDGLTLSTTWVTAGRLDRGGLGVGGGVEVGVGVGEGVLSSAVDSLQPALTVTSAAISDITMIK